jgi:hypothetical protein
METSVQFQEPVSVVGVFTVKKSGEPTAAAPAFTPKKMIWQGRTYTFTQLAYHHKQRYGRTVMHIFHLTDGSKDFRLRFDTEDLTWFLEEVYDPTA